MKVTRAIDEQLSLPFSTQPAKKEVAREETFKLKEAIPEMFPQILNEPVLKRECERQGIKFSRVVDWLNSDNRLLFSVYRTEKIDFTEEAQKSFTLPYITNATMHSTRYIEVILYIIEDFYISDNELMHDIKSLPFGMTGYLSGSNESQKIWNFIMKYTHETPEKLYFILVHELSHLIDFMRLKDEGEDAMNKSQTKYESESNVIPHAWISDERSPVLNQLRLMIREGWSDDDMIQYIRKDCPSWVRSDEQAKDLIELAMYPENSVTEFRKVRRSDVVEETGFPMIDCVADAFPALLNDPVLKRECDRQKLKWSTFVEWAKSPSTLNIIMRSQPFNEKYADLKYIMSAQASYDVYEYPSVFVAFTLDINHSKMYLPSEMENHVGKKFPLSSPSAHIITSFAKELGYVYDAEVTTSIMIHELSHVIIYLKARNYQTARKLHNERTEDIYNGIPYPWVNMEREAILNQLRLMIREGWSDDEMVNYIIEKTRWLKSEQQARDLIELAMYPMNSLTEKEYRKLPGWGPKKRVVKNEPQGDNQ
jgi:hypothetical protein